MTDKKNYKLYILYATYVLIIIVHVILLTCIWTVNVSRLNEHVIDYTECEMDPNKTCKDFMRENKNIDCVCRVPFNLTNDLNGEVIIYYEMESYDQTNSSYIISKDDSQLSGILSNNPSENCEPYRYDDKGKPIAPCGAIADSMFTDTYSLIYDIPAYGKEYVLVPKLYTGLISSTDKSGFRNPPGDITVAFQNFSKPKNWEKNIYELDERNPDNNGFQNEKFIGWMHTEWKRKPIWRVNTTHEIFKNGLPAGPYRCRIGYNYPLSRYDGIRKVILVSLYKCESCILWKILCTVIILLFLLVCIFIATLYATRNGYLELRHLQSDALMKLMTGNKHTT